MNTGTAPEVRARRYLDQRFPGVETQPLRQEASSRQYWRLVGRDLVLMIRNDRFLERRDPYCRATELFRSCRVPVPGILETVGEAGLILLEDGGDTLLSDMVEDAPEQEVLDYYARAVAVLRRLRRGTGLLSPLFPAARLNLGPDRLEWELHFFHDHWIRGMRGAALSPGEWQVLQEFYRDLCLKIWTERPPVLCHRDYHARNLLVADDRSLIVTDHQDAQWGPQLYDLASLLRDPYVSLPPNLEEEVLGMWERDVSKWRSSDVRLAYERTALQRNLKAAGTYACQVTVFGRKQFRPSFAPTLSHARTAFSRLPEYGEALRVFEAHGLLEIPNDLLS